MTRWRVILAIGAASIVAIATIVTLIPERRHQNRVVGRLDGDLALRFEPEPPAPTKVRIGATTRTAVPALIDVPLEVDIDASVTNLSVSIGVRSLTGADTRATFVVSGLTSSGWQSLLSDTLGPLRHGWVDHTIDLGQSTTPVTRLRFESQVVQAGEGPKAEPFWGSILLQSSRVDWPTAALTRLGFQPDEAPNLILISLDTLAADHLGSFGGPEGVSPNLDAIFRKSLSFRRAYAQYPNTPVSHASLFTGLYPIHHGVYETSPWLRTETLAWILAQRGYLNAAITENAFVSSDFGFDHGFDSYDNGVASTVNADDKTLGNPLETFQKAQAWLEAHRDRQRFALFVHTYAVHAPYTPQDGEALAFTNSIDPGYQGPFATEWPGGLEELRNNSGKGELSAKDRNRLAALYAGEIRYLDRIVGNFIRYLDEAFAGSPPLVIFFSDHGEEFGEHGMLGHGETLHGQALHVPLVMYWPGKIPPRTSDALVQLVDVLPTTLDLFDIDAPRDYDGRSLVPLFSAETSHDEVPAFAELKTAWGTCRRLGQRDDCLVNRLAVQTDRFKLITSELPSGAALYDLSTDPREMHDVAARYPDELHRLREILANYQAGNAPSAPTSAGGQIDDATRERLRALGYRD